MRAGSGVIRFDVVSSEIGQKLEREKQVHLVIPEGTKVLTRPGPAWASLLMPRAPAHSYRVRFAVMMAVRVNSRWNLN